MYSLCFKLCTNYTQTLHWGVSNPTLRAFKTLHWGIQNPTQRAFAKLYTKRNTNPTFCFWTWMERMELRTWMERIVRNVCNERNERYERKTGNGNRRWRASSLLRAVSSLLPAAPKIQQFWAIFQRFDINIFNFREHFPSPNFAYSAHNFSLPSPNLN